MSKFWIQKPVTHNCPIGQSGPLHYQCAVFQEFQPTVSLPGCEWIEVVRADSFTRKKELEALISGHIEAMRPLLEEWGKLK